jgi:hypothetical protein
MPKMIAIGGAVAPHTDVKYNVSVHFYFWTETPSGSNNAGWCKEAQFGGYIDIARHFIG